MATIKKYKNMIKKYKEYQKINEEFNKKNLVGLALYLTTLFSGIGGDVPRPKLDIDYFNNYVKTMNIANNDPLVNEVLKDFKLKIASDPKLLNKQEIYNTIDNTPIIYRKNDKICKLLYDHSDRSTGLSASSMCITLTNGKTFIILSPDADYVEILHELSHAIESVIKVDPSMLDMFNFNHTYQQQNDLYKSITNFEYSLRSGLNDKEIKYLNNPSEVYSRLNTLKMFLYKNKFIKSTIDDIPLPVLLNLINGKIYKSLDAKNKRILSTADFVQILIFLDIRKFPKINQYVQTLKKNKTNII